MSNFDQSDQDAWVSVEEGFKNIYTGELLTEDEFFELWNQD